MSVNLSEIQSHLVTYELATQAYREYMQDVINKLPPNHRITYIPFTPEQRQDEANKLAFAEASEIPAIMANTNIIVCISRDEDPNPDYKDQRPERNTSLTPSGLSNVDTSVGLYNVARQQGNEDIKYIATGRMHNRAVRPMLALPIVADFIGLNPEDAYHVSESRFKELLDAAFTANNVANLQLSSDDEQVAASCKALIAILNDPKYDCVIPTVNSTPEELKKIVEAIWQEYHNFPRMSTSRLMIERAVELGVPLESIYEDDGAVDTITNLLDVALMLDSLEGLKELDNKGQIVIVAGSDHLPRTTWIADHILPDGWEIVCVESDPALSEEAYEASCIRERNSFNKGSVWIGDTRNLIELQDITNAGYFGTNRLDAHELAAQVNSAVHNQ